MREAKTIIVTGLVVVLVLLVAGLGYKALNGNGNNPSQTVQQEQALSDLKERIGQLTILKEEQTLTRDIMIIQQEIRKLQLKAQAPPVIEGTFIPVEDLPEKMQE